jgi:ATP-dependent RNA helicase RhlB
MNFIKTLFGSRDAPASTPADPEPATTDASPRKQQERQAEKPHKERPEKRPVVSQKQAAQPEGGRGEKTHKQPTDARQSPEAEKKQSSGKAPAGGASHSKPQQRPSPPAEIPASEFDKLDLPLPVNQAIATLGFTTMTGVQAEALPHALDGRDVIAQAQTGTGKTAAFLLAIITYQLENPELSARNPGTPFALIIAPTRELAMQIAADAEDLALYVDLDVVTLVGGLDYDKQRQQCKGNVDIIVATPGRLLDFCRSRIVDLSSVETMVIDEADRMLSMGFIPDVKAIVSRTPKKDKRQTQFFSATYSYDIRQLAASWTRDAVVIQIEPEQLAVDTVNQIVYTVSSSEKYTVLYNLITQSDLQRVIVFANRRDQTRTLEARLRRDGIITGLLSGEVHQKKRVKTLEDFKNGRIRVLVATDVAGRGIHVDDVSHVVNYNLPEDPEDYVHRIGRTGRAGNQGTSVSLACEDDAFMLPQIQEMLGGTLESEHPPEVLLEPISRQRRDRG